jgi:hypothetical protein
MHAEDPRPCLYIWHFSSALLFYYIIPYYSAGPTGPILLSIALFLLS